MPKRTPLDWEDLERELHAAGVAPEEIDAGARQLLAQARGHQLAETRKQLGLGQKGDRRRHGGERRPGIPDRARRSYLLCGHRPLCRGSRRTAGPRCRFR